MKMKKLMMLLLGTVFTGALISACAEAEPVYPEAPETVIIEEAEETGETETAAEAGEETAGTEAQGETGETAEAAGTVTDPGSVNTGSYEQTSEEYAYFSLDQVPAYNGTQVIPVHEGMPFFTEEELDAARESYEYYEALDDLGRCVFAQASAGTDTLPTRERGDIHTVRPSGWQKNCKWERCHLIAHSITGEDANERNLITGTHAMNEAMQVYEVRITNYIKDNPDAHVLYRVTPYYYEDELVASGVLMEGMSVEDEGEAIRFCVFLYNAQTGEDVDYALGYVDFTEDYIDPSSEEAERAKGEELENADYIANKNSMIFNDPDCSGIAKTRNSNRIPLNCSEEEAEQMGYRPHYSCIGA